MLLGLTLAIIAGLLGGSVLAPIKRMKKWPFEASWALYCLWAYFIMPWAVAAATVPNLFSIYARVSAQTMWICALSGLGWGFAVVLFGVAVRLAGLTLASAIIYGASVAVGSLAPLIVSHAEKLAAPQGRMIVAANAVMIAGIVLSALAGKARDEARDRSAAGPRTHAADFRKGLLASIAAALLSSLFNIALAYGGEFNRLAVEAGASPLNAANAQWAFTVTFGYLPNIVLSLLALSRRHLWTVYGKSALSHWLWPPVMGAMWIGGTALYGSAATALGKLGPVIGWPIYMSVMITVGSMWGWLTGEWAGAPSRAINRLVIGIAIQVAAIAMLSAVSQ